MGDILKYFLSDIKKTLIDACYDDLAEIECIQKNFYDLIIVNLVMSK